MGQPNGDPAQSVDPGAQSGTGVPVDPATSVVPPVAGGQVGETPKVYTQADVDALTARMQAADRTAAQNAKKLKDIEDGQLSEADKTKKALDEATKALAKAHEQNETASISNAFLADRTYDWHNAEAALTLLDKSNVTWDAETGKVSGMKAALDALAKANPFLVKPPAGQGDDGNAQGQTGASGTARQQGKGTNREELERKFPAMRGRVG